MKCSVIMQCNLIKYTFIIGCASAVMIGCSKMDTEDVSSVESGPQQQEVNTTETKAASSGPTTKLAEILDDIKAPNEPQDLSLTWPEGKRFVYEIGIEQVTSTGDSPFAAAMDSKADQHFTYALTALEDSGDGKSRLEMEFLAAKLNLDMMGNKLNYDSANQNAAESIDPMYSMLAGLDALMGQTLTITLSQDGEIDSVEGVEEMYQKVIKALPDEAKSVAQGIVQEDQFIQLIKYPFIPDAPVKSGDTWRKTYTQVFGINGAMDIDNTYTYMGQTIQEDVHLNVLSYEGTVITDEAQNDEMMGMELSLDGGKNTGVIKLDPTFGHIIESDSLQEMSMVMSIPESMKGTLPAPPKISIKMTQNILLKEVSDVSVESE